MVNDNHMEEYKTANEHQVGGKHYQKEYQHWDFVMDSGLTYLEGCATKYVARHKDKNGKEDLQKAIHYIDKCMELSCKPKPHISPLKQKLITLGLHIMSYTNKYRKLVHITNWIRDKIKQLQRVNTIKYKHIFRFTKDIAKKEANIIYLICKGDFEQARTKTVELTLEQYYDKDKSNNSDYFKG